MRLCEKIKHNREKLGLSLDKLSGSSKICKSYLWELESGKSENPTLRKLVALASSLNVTVDYLRGDGDKLNPSDLEILILEKIRKLSKTNQKKVEQIIDLWKDK
jgi:transcriptional regulator with XRE-family HTH domain